MDLRKYLHLSRLLLKNKGCSPIYLIFFVTSRCGCRCQHCFYWQSTNKPENELSLAEIDKISGSMDDLLQVTLTGGDAALREDLAEIARVFALNNNVQNFSIGTNGSQPEMIEQHLTRMMSWANQRPVNITVDLSMDGIGSDHDDIRQTPGLFEKVLETIQMIKTMQKVQTTINLCVDITVSALNQDKLEPLYRTVRDEIKPDILNALLIRGNPRNPEAKNVSLDKYEEICNWIKHDILLGTYPGYDFAPALLHAKDIVLRELVLKTARQNAFQVPCTAGLLTGVIYPEGNVAACELRDEPLGSLREADYDMKKVWLSPAAEELRRDIKEKKCFCYHQCFLSNNVLFNPRFTPRLLWNIMKQRNFWSLARQ